MKNFEITDEAYGYLDKIAKELDSEKSAIADALTVVTESMQKGADAEEMLNVCALLGRYNRLITLMS